MNRDHALLVSQEVPLEVIIDRVFCHFIGPTRQWLDQVDIAERYAGDGLVAQIA